MQETGCVYLSLLGGGSPLLSSSIRDVITVEWRDLVSHYRLAHLRVDRLEPAVVAIDAHGNSLYENIAKGIKTEKAERGK
jgi:fumarate hydratase subunit beta